MSRVYTSLAKRIRANLSFAVQHMYTNFIYLYHDAIFHIIQHNTKYNLKSYITLVPTVSHRKNFNSNTNNK